MGVGGSVGAPGGRVGSEVVGAVTVGDVKGIRRGAKRRAGIQTTVTLVQAATVVSGDGSLAMPKGILQMVILLVIRLGFEPMRVSSRKND